MSRHGDLTLEWAGEFRTFRLALGEIRRLQEATDAGPYELLQRMVNGRWRVDDLRETIRLGLEGGGLAPKEAGRLIRAYVDPPKPLLDSVLVASQILEAALSGALDESLPKAPGEETQARSSPEAKSPSEPSTDGDRFLDISPSISTEWEFGSSKLALPDISEPIPPKRRSRPRRPQKNITT